MGWNVSQCKKMIQTAEDTGSILSIGHQRHYSMLYAHATEILKNDVLGDVKYIRALWHRNNAWPFKPTDEQKDKLVKRSGAAVLQGRLVQPGPARGLRRPQGKRAGLRLRQRGAADPLALYNADGRRPDGGAGQPPARRVQHLPRPRPSAGRHRRRRQVFLRPPAGLRRNQRLRLPDQLQRPRLATTTSS